MMRCAPSKFFGNLDAHNQKTPTNLDARNPKIPSNRIEPIAIHVHNNAVHEVFTLSLSEIFCYYIYSQFPGVIKILRFTTHKLNKPIRNVYVVIRNRGIYGILRKYRRKNPVSLTSLTPCSAEKCSESVIFY